MKINEILFESGFAQSNYVFRQRNMSGSRSDRELESLGLRKTKFGDWYISKRLLDQRPELQREIAKLWSVKEALHTDNQSQETPKEMVHIVYRMDKNGLTPVAKYSDEDEAQKIATELENETNEAHTVKSQVYPKMTYEGKQNASR